MDCILWEGATNGRYGVVSINGKNVYAHRLVYALNHGPLPKGKYVCHTCDVPLCVNPDHLFLGTQKDNMQDAKRKGRLADSSLTRHMGTSNGNAKLTPHDVALIRHNCKPAPSGKGAGQEWTVAWTARRYGVSRTVIRAILDREAWGWV